MHELPITQNILEIALKHGNQANAKRILYLNIVMGQLTSFIDDSIQFYWDIISKDTIAEGAVLNFKRIPAEFKCLDCYHVYLFETDEFLCPVCGGSNVEICAGKEFFLDSIDIE